MYSILLQTHSLLRYLVLIFLIIVIVNSFLGFSNKKAFGKTDDLLGITLFSLTHTQFLIAIILYFVSPLVQFNAATMKDPSLRYWTTEHSVVMLTAIVLITMARVTSRKMNDDTAKHRRMLIFNMMAFVIILLGIAMSQRGFFSMPGATE